MVIALVVPVRHSSSLEASVRTVNGAQFRWVLYEHEGQIRGRVQSLLSREQVDGIFLGPMPYDRCRDVLPPDLPVAVPRIGAIELAITFARAMGQGWPAAPVSIDTVDEQVVTEVSEALGLDRAHVATLPYATEQTVNDIVRFHRDHLHHEGESYAISGRSEVGRRLATRMHLLKADLLPATNLAVLHELALRIQSKQDSERHLAAGVFTIVPGSGRHTLDRARAELMHLLLSTPEFADAWVENRGTRGVVVFAHKALLERATGSWTHAPRIGTGDARLPFRVAVGFGLGASARTCVVLAEQAAARSERDGCRAYLMGDRGLMVGPMAPNTTPLAFNYREHGQALEGLARTVGLSPMTLSRLAALERRLAGRPVSPSELAGALAVTDPSGRRLMRALVAHGLAADAGTSQRGSKGRPSHLWRLHVVEAAGA